MDDQTTRRRMRCPKCSKVSDTTELVVCQACHRAMCKDCFGPSPDFGLRPICKVCRTEKTLTMM